MDEPTANIDSRTDRLVQQIIKSNFKDITMITIAHRIDTVLSSDKILVMDKGKVSEFSAPGAQLTDHNSYLSQMVSAARSHKENHKHTAPSQ